MFKIDKIKQKIRDKKIVIGTHVKWSESNIVELFAMAGFDAIWIDGEHGSMTIETVQNHVRAAQAWDAAAFFRVPWNDPVIIKPYLELGIDAFVFPFINTAADAEKAVKSCMYPPDGIRGFGPGRINRYGQMPIDEYLKKSRQIWKVIQIEHITAVENIDEILKVKGIDAVVVGQFDLSGSMGLLTQITHPRVKEKLDIVAGRCKAAGIPFGTSMGFNPEVIKDWFLRGASFIFLGGDQDFLKDGAHETLEKTLEVYNTTSGGKL